MTTWRVVAWLTALVAATVEADLANDGEEYNEWQAFSRRILSSPKNWKFVDKLFFCVIIMIGMDLLSRLGKAAGGIVKSKDIPVRGKHLDELTWKDNLFIAISKLQTGPFVYFCYWYCWSEANVLWNPHDISFKTVMLPLPVLFVVFDFFYTILHWALHIKAVYGFVHKHHHTQKAPSRAVEDAINVHPLEFFLGEYNHLWSVYLVTRHLQIEIHALGFLAFLIVGGVLAGWNHTRNDIEWSLFGVQVFDSKAHDVHHRIPQSNYGQYIVFWDTLFGTYREYDPNDRINPKAQLDPKTGKSLEYVPQKNQ